MRSNLTLLACFAVLLCAIPAPAQDEVFIPKTEAEVLEAEDEAERQAQQQRAEEQRQLRAEADAKRRQQQVIDRGRLDRLILEGQQIIQLLDEALAEAKVWDATVTPLLTNASGRLIAADSEAVDQFRAHYFRTEHAQPNEIEAAQQRVQALVQVARDERAKPQINYVPEAELTNQYRAERQTAQRYLAGYRGPRQAIEGLLVALSGKGVTPATSTLQATVNQIVAQEAAVHAQELNQQSAEATKRANDIAAERTKVAIDEAERQQAEADRSRAEATKRALDAEATKVADIAEKTKVAQDAEHAEAQHQALIARAQSADVQQRLAPFIEQNKGNILRVTHGQITWSSGGYGDNIRSLSLSLIRQAGALEPTPAGKRILTEIATYPKNMRTHWSAPEAVVDQAQEDMRELGAVLVELGMLRP